MGSPRALAALKRAAWLGLGLALLLTLSSALAAHRFTRRRASVQPEQAQPLLGISPQLLRLNARDGVELGAWLFEHPQARCAVVLVHGNGSRRQALLGRAQLALQSSCHALAVTLRAHGDSEGDRNDFGFGARHDVQAAVAHLQARFPDLPRYVFGQSLGAAAALFAAPELGDAVKGYLLESPYASLQTAIMNRLHMRLPASLVPAAYAWLTLWSSAFLPGGVPAICPERAAAQVRCEARFIVLAGAEDKRATVQEAQRIIESLPAGAQLEVFEQAAHSQLWSQDAPRYRAVFKRWLLGP